MKMGRSVFSKVSFTALVLSIILDSHKDITMGNQAINDRDDLFTYNYSLDEKDEIGMYAMTGYVEDIICERDEIGMHAMTGHIENIIGEKENISYDSLKYYIYEKCNEYEVPFDVMTTIGHQESGGTWDTNGVVSYSGDYGQFQINLRWNLGIIEQDLNFTEQDILYNPYKNIEASIYLIKRIMNLYGYTMDNFDYENIFGTYNGWTNWREKEMAIDYAASCMSILSQNLYPYEKVEEKVMVK